VKAVLWSERFVRDRFVDHGFAQDSDARPSGGAEGIRSSSFRNRKT
jgi:hypothetical protein